MWGPWELHCCYTVEMVQQPVVVVPFHDGASVHAGELPKGQDELGDGDSSADVHAAVGHFLDASGLEAFPDAADARRQAMATELLGDLSLEVAEPDPHSSQ